jgi:hypothetical protein
MGRVLRSVLAGSALLQPLGAEMIATPLAAAPVPNVNSHVFQLTTGGLKLASNFAGMSFANLFAHATPPTNAMNGILSSAKSKTQPFLRPGQNLTNPSVHQHKRADGPVPADPAPVGWTYFGCFNDNGSVDEATNTGFYWTPEMESILPTPPLISADVCTASCSFNGLYAYAGLNGSNCYCFNERPRSGGISSTCETPCYNNEGEAYGGDGPDSVKLTVYKRGRSANVSPRPAAPPPQGWKYTGCYALEGFVLVSIFDGYTIGWNSSDAIASPQSSVEICTQKCLDNGYWLFAGLTTNGCFCANNPAIPTTQLTEDHCQAQCPDHFTEACGGWGYATWYIAIYKQSIEHVPVPIPSTDDGERWFKGCYRTDDYLESSPANKDLKDEARAGTCIQYCGETDKYDLAGIIGTTCYCNRQADFARRDLMVPAQYCNVTCSGNEDQGCGGKAPTGGYDDNEAAISLYGRIPDAIGSGGGEIELPVLIPGAIQWSEEGCYINSAVNESAPYSYRNDSAPSMDPELCISICKKNNNWLYAMPFGDGTCYCAGELPEGISSDDEEQCNKPCLSYPNELCGGFGNDQVARVRYWKNPLESARTELPPVSPLLPIVRLFE